MSAPLPRLGGAVKHAEHGSQCVGNRCTGPKSEFALFVEERTRIDSDSHWFSRRHLFDHGQWQSQFRRHRDVIEMASTVLIDDEFIATFLVAMRHQLVLALLPGQAHFAIPINAGDDRAAPGQHAVFTGQHYFARYAGADPVNQAPHLRMSAAHRHQAPHGSVF